MKIFLFILLIVFVPIAFAVENKAEVDASKIESVQPTPEAWSKIVPGMSLEEVNAILGKPLHLTEVPERFANSPTYSRVGTYGRIRFNHPSMPSDYEYCVHFQLGKVFQKYDPFDGNISKDGAPTVPTLISPLDKSKHDFYPRILDLRWQPSSGTYPIEYRVEVESGQYGRDGEIEYVSESFRPKKTSIPYHVISFVGRGPGRWRVMAINKIGKSEWSEWRYFRFEK